MAQFLGQTVAIFENEHQIENPTLRVVNSVKQTKQTVQLQFEDQVEMFEIKAKPKKLDYEGLSFYVACKTEEELYIVPKQEGTLVVHIDASDEDVPFKYTDLKIDRSDGFLFEVTLDNGSKATVLGSLEPDSDVEMQDDSSVGCSYYGFVRFE
jgi:hypothetical protein